MSGFREPRPDLVLPNPGGFEDPLGESVLDSRLDWLRVFEPRGTCLVIGRHQDPQLELDCLAAQRDGIPIFRRVSGGGAVVLAPGMVVIAIRMQRDHLGTTTYLQRVNDVLGPMLSLLCAWPVTPLGLGDLTVEASTGLPRKVLGASLRQSSGMAIYLGSLLVDDHHDLMRSYLRAPSRQPDYRESREHAQFCSGLGRFGLRAPEICPPIDQALRAGLAAFAMRRTA